MELVRSQIEQIYLDLTKEESEIAEVNQVLKQVYLLVVSLLDPKRLNIQSSIDSIDYVSCQYGWEFACYSLQVQQEKEIESILNKLAAILVNLDDHKADLNDLQRIFDLVITIINKNFLILNTFKKSTNEDLVRLFESGVRCFLYEINNKKSLTQLHTAASNYDTQSIIKKWLKS